MRPSSVSGSSGPVCLRMPSRTSHVRLRPWPPRSSRSTTRSECSLWRKPPRPRSRSSSSIASSPAWPNGGWPTSCPTAIASVRSSFRRSARATPRAIPAASSVCVSRVRKWSPSGSTKTCVLWRRRRNALEWTIRSRSRWNGVRRRHSSSGASRPRVSYERTASGESHCSSCSRTASAKPSATCPAISDILSETSPVAGGPEAAGTVDTCADAPASPSRRPARRCLRLGEPPARRSDLRGARRGAGGSRDDALLRGHDLRPPARERPRPRRLRRPVDDLSRERQRGRAALLARRLPAGERRLGHGRRALLQLRQGGQEGRAARLDPRARARRRDRGRRRRPRRDDGPARAADPGLLPHPGGRPLRDADPRGSDPARRCERPGRRLPGLGLREDGATLRPQARRRLRARRQDPLGPRRGRGGVRPARRRRRARRRSSSTTSWPRAGRSSRRPSGSSSAARVPSSPRRPTASSRTTPRRSSPRARSSASSSPTPWRTTRSRSASSVEVVSVAGLFAEAIKRVHGRESISVLFRE